MGRPKKSAGGQPADSVNAGAPDAGVADVGAPSAAPSWKLTEDLLKTLNQELGGLKEYVLADLRGEITSLRSKKLQLETDINRLQSHWDSLVSDRDRAQQQQWAQQFSQVMAQNLLQDLQAQLLGTDATGTERPDQRPEQRLLILREQIAGLESVLGGRSLGFVTNWAATKAPSASR
ncbi:MAG: hypothetical protein HC857_03885 [Synechococcales cyanobacterium RU_4_20]|nr:hypothetical protein [Synechococcales cyanobacterium RU_4_20]